MRRNLITACLVVGIACVSTASRAAPNASLAPPAGSTLLGRYAAKGAQVYTCISKDGALAWGAAEPDAELEGADGKVTIHHGKGPSWEARDHSRIVGAVVSRMPAPSAGAVPWLLLATTASGSGLLAEVKYVVRQDTAGGAQPAGACARPGQQARVPYTATYAFYK